MTGDLLSRLPDPARNLAARVLDTWPGRTVERGARALIEIEVFDRSMTLAAQAFTSVFPLLILVATLRPRESHNQIGSPSPGPVWRWFASPGTPIARSVQ